MTERRATIFNIQKYNMYDGPGVRTLIFFKGCPLRCRWCSNPESQLRRPQVLFKSDFCTHCGACASVCPAGVHAMTPQGRHVVRPDAECTGCRACEKRCLASALAVAGEVKSISELMAVVEEDKPFYDTSGGGVTLGGGEALAQPEAALNLLTACKMRGIHTALETCGMARPETIQAVAEVADLWLYDVKHMDPERHHALTGARNETILANLRALLENRRHVTIRVPLLKGVNDDEANLRALADFLAPYKDRGHFHGVDLLPYHKMGVGKYEQLGLAYPLADLNASPGLSEADVERAQGVLRRQGVAASVIRH